MGEGVSGWALRWASRGSAPRDWPVSDLEHLEKVEEFDPKVALQVSTGKHLHSKPVYIFMMCYVYILCILEIFGPVFTFQPLIYVSPLFFPPLPPAILPSRPHWDPLVCR